MKTTNSQSKHRTIWFCTFFFHRRTQERNNKYKKFFFYVFKSVFANILPTELEHLSVENWRWIKKICKLHVRCRFLWLSFWDFRRLETWRVFENLMIVVLRFLKYEICHCEFINVWCWSFSGWNRRSLTLRDFTIQTFVFLKF